MDIAVRGQAVRSFALATCIVLSSTWAVAAQAQSFPFVQSEKVLQTTETIGVRTTQHLGSAVAVAGDRVLSVGGPGNVYVFGKNAQGAWSQLAKLVAPDGGALTGPIVFDGTHALIRGYTPAQTSVVYHFQYDGTRWRALAILRGAESFGRSIAMEGCTALISSSIESTQSARAQPSFVHFFDRCRTGQWTYINSFATPSGGGASFGYSVALSGTNALVGAPAAGTNGRVYQYIRTGDSWALKETFEENANPQHGMFGQAVAISSNLAIVSSHLWRGDGLGQGQIIRFSVNGSTITQLGPQVVSWPFDAWGYEGLGETVVITPSYVFASAPSRLGFIPWTDTYTNGAWTPMSWVMAFPRRGANELIGPVAIPTYDHDRGAPPELDQPLPYYLNVRFGSDIAVSGSTLIVGSELFRVPTKPKIEEGRVYAYDIPPWTP
jgi:hypothetical protein